MPHRPVLNRRAYWFGFVILFLATSAAYADPILDTVGNTYKDASAGWGDALMPMAKSVFVKLALLEVLWSGIWWVIERDDPNQILVAMLRKIMPLMFFFAILQNFDTWIPAVIDGFSTAGQAAGKISALTPSSVLDRGLDVATRITEAAANISLFSKDIGKFILAGLAALAILLCFGVIAGQMLVTLVESYIVVSGGVLFLGFAGSRWTTTFAEKYLSYAVSVGVKLFVTYLVIGAGQHVSDTWANLITTDMKVSDYLVIFAGSLVYMFLAWQIPSLASSMMTGAVSMTLGAAAATAATMGAGMAGAAGLAQKAVGGSAGSLMGAAQAGDAAIERAKAGGATNFAQVTAGAAGHLAAAGAQAVGDSIRGLSDGSTGQSLAGRLQASTAAKREQMAAGGPVAPEIGSALPPGAAAAPPAPPAPPAPQATGGAAGGGAAGGGAATAASTGATPAATSSATGTGVPSSAGEAAPGSESMSAAAAEQAGAFPDDSMSHADAAAAAPAGDGASATTAPAAPQTAAEKGPWPFPTAKSVAAARAAQAAAAPAPTATAVSAAGAEATAAPSAPGAGAGSAAAASPAGETSSAGARPAPGAPPANEDGGDDGKKDNRNAMQKLAEHVEALGKMPNDSAAGAGVQINLKHD